jgi:hypothetical protein
MSQLSPDHIPGATNNSDFIVHTATSSKSTEKPTKKRNRKRAITRATKLDQPTSSSDSSSDEALEQTYGKRRKKVFSTPNRRPSDGTAPLFSLPSQNLDVSIHAPYHSATPIQFSFFGNLPQGYYPYSPSPVAYPLHQYPELPQHQKKDKGKRRADQQDMVNNKQSLPIISQKKRKRRHTPNKLPRSLKIVPQ